MNLEGLILQDWVRWSETWGKSKNSLRGASSCPMARRNTSQDQKMGGIRVGGQRPQYDGTDAVNYQWVTAYAADILFPHIKFLERRWSEYDETKDIVCDKMMNKTGIYVPRCIEKSWYWENTIAGMVHIKYRNLKCNFYNASRKAFLSKCSWQYSFWWLFEKYY